MPLILEKITDLLDEMQASDVKIIDVKSQTTVTDHMIIASGRASRHVKAIAEKVLEEMKHSGFYALSATGLEEGDWALIDFGDCVLHVMLPESRQFYNLEGLWEEH